MVRVLWHRRTVKWVVPRFILETPRADLWLRAADWRPFVQTFLMIVFWRLAMGSQLDIQGAIGEGIDSLFISGGLAAKETATVTQPDPEKLSQYVLEKQLDPTFSIGFLR